MFNNPSDFAVFVGVASVIIEVLASLLDNSRLKKILYGFVIGFVAFSSVVMVSERLMLGSLLIGLIVIFRIINALRVVDARMKEPRLSIVSRRTSLLLVTFQVIVFWCWQHSLNKGINSQFIFESLTVLSLLISIMLLVSTSRNLKKTVIRPTDKYMSDSELPSISVCIPARNETEDLPACLSSILDSDYPKLEILVYDDCSQDKTSEIIKGYAHKGVRFIAGEPVKQGWLAKNQAYLALAEDSSGEILVFCGVDVRMNKTALRSLVASMMARKKLMISVFPKGVQQMHHAGLLQPMRYWWELALPRRMFNRPPVLSTIWAIHKSALDDHGGIKAVKNSVLPEGYFARALVKYDSYSFMRSNEKMMFETAKKLPEQWQTAVRVRYPLLRKRPENVLILLLAETWLLLTPTGLFLVGFFSEFSLIWVIAGINAWILMFTHYKILSAWNKSNASLGVALFPAAVIVDFVVTFMSMLRYEFSEVAWKQRNVCIPVMRHYSSLPKR